MSIASRIEAIEEHLTEDYSVLTLAGADLTNVDKNIINLKPTWKERLLYFMNNGTDVVWNNWDKVVGEGESLSLNNTLEAKMKIELKGNTYQYSTTGKNKFNVSDISQTTDNRGLTYKVEDNVFTISGTNTSTSSYSLFSWLQGGSTGNYFNTIFEKGKTFTLSANKSLEGLYFQINYFKEGSSSQSQLVNLSSLGGKATFTIPQDYDNIGNIFLGVLGTATTINGSFSLQLEEGSEKTSFEPYTNGASPNPDYPQEIQVVSGDNTIKVSGENKFDKDNPNVIEGYIAKSNATIYLTNNQIIIYVRCKPNTKYCVRKELVSTPNNNVFRIGTTSTIPTDGSVISQFYVPENEETATDYTFTTNANAQYIVWYCYVRESFYLIKNGVYIGECTTYPISLGNIELCKIGDYQDFIDKSTGKNLWDKATANYNKGISSDGTLGNNNNLITSDYIEVQPNTSYYLSNTIGNSYGRMCAYYDENKTFISFEAKTGTSRVSTSITTPNNAKYMRVACLTGDENICMVNKGSTPLPYEPYGTGWYKYGAIGKVVLDGTQNLSVTNWRASATSVGWLYPKSIVDNIVPSTNKKPYYILSDKLLEQNYGDMYNMSVDNGISFVDSSSYSFVIRTTNTSLVDNTSVNNYLSTNPIIAYYPLATPTYTPITDSTLVGQLDTIKKSYNSQTNISQTNDDLPFILDVTALQELS